MVSHTRGRTSKERVSMRLVVRMDYAGQGRESQQREISYEYGAQPLWRVVRMKLIGHVSSLGAARAD